PRYHLRKEHDVKQEIPEAFERFVDAAVHVDGVGELLEGEEGDADGQHNLLPRQGRPPKVGAHGAGIVKKEVGVFEVEQHADI
nr:hypothetical protein [Tanacetum cinerariifolium]